MKNEVMFSSKSDEWETPQWLFDELDREFNFNLDPCATDENHKCPIYITKETDGLSVEWGGYCVVYRKRTSTSALPSGQSRRIKLHEGHTENIDSEE